MSSEKRKPDWTLCVNDAADEPAGSKPRWRSIGAAWESEKGNLWIKLDAGVRLEGTAMLFPYREPRAPSRYTARTWQRAPSTNAPAQTEKLRQSIDKPTATPTSEPDYMERKRLERAKPPATPLATDDCPDPEAPDWL